MELFHPAKRFEITFHINFGSFCENPVQDVTIFVAQTAQNCSNQSVNWVAWNILVSVLLNPTVVNGIVNIFTEYFLL